MAIVKRPLRTGQPQPYYLGVVTNKRPATTGKGAHVHYILVAPAAAARLGMSAKSTLKKEDDYVGGAVFDTKRKYKDGAGKAKTTDAKRSITPMSKQVDIYTGNYVKDLKGKGTTQEFYTVGFPSTLSLIEILYFVEKRMPKAKVVRSGKNVYVPKNITLPKDVKVEAPATAVAK